MADESIDSVTVEQLGVYVRYVDVDVAQLWHCEEMKWDEGILQLMDNLKTTTQYTDLLF